MKTKNQLKNEVAAERQKAEEERIKQETRDQEFATILLDMEIEGMIYDIERAVKSNIDAPRCSFDIMYKNYSRVFPLHLKPDEFDSHEPYAALKRTVKEAGFNLEVKPAYFPAEARLIVVITDADIKEGDE